MPEGIRTSGSGEKEPLIISSSSVYRPGRGHKNDYPGKENSHAVARSARRKGQGGGERTIIQGRRMLTQRRGARGGWSKKGGERVSFLFDACQKGFEPVVPGTKNP